MCFLQGSSNSYGNKHKLIVAENSERKMSVTNVRVMNADKQQFNNGFRAQFSFPFAAIVTGAISCDKYFTRKVKNEIF